MTCVTSATFKDLKILQNKEIKINKNKYNGFKLQPYLERKMFDHNEAST